MKKSKSGKFKPHLQPSLISQALEESRSISDIDSDSFVISFRHLDKTQGDTLNEWESINILAKAIDVLAGYCNRSLITQQDKKFTIYGGFPPKCKTYFRHPDHVPEDAQWARIHITGKQIIAGHVVRNIFFVVFLDNKHQFWVSNKT